DAAGAGKRSSLRLRAGAAVWAKRRGPIAVAGVVVQRHYRGQTVALDEWNQGEAQAAEVVKVHEVGLFGLQHGWQPCADGRGPEIVVRFEGDDRCAPDTQPVL